LKKPTKREIELLDIIDGLQAQLREIYETISPHRIAKHEYYVGVAKRFRQHAEENESVIRPIGLGRAKRVW
jgi:hypothetical protein